MKTTSTLALLFTTTCLSLAAETFTPIIPQRGVPVLLDYAMFPIAKWKSLSTNSFPWFVETPTGWYIDWDCERTNITWLVVHHSAGTGRETPEDISETVYRQVYGGDGKSYSVYRDSKYKEPYVFGLLIHSGHVINGRETFSAYHYLVYSDGRIITTLVPHREVDGKLMVDMVAWGAGNWRVNCSSVQVCLLGTWSKDKPPPSEALASLAKIIHYYRARVPDLKVVSHDEVRTAGKKDCPGGWFEEWRRRINK